MSERVYVIAEAGVNHNGSLERALEMVRVAARAGADAVKFQTFKAEQLVSRDAAKAQYQKETTDAAESQFGMLKKLELSSADHAALVAEAQRCGIAFLSTAFDIASMDFLVRETSIGHIKIPSGEATNAPFLLHAARQGLPVLLSTGMCTLGEIEQALRVLAFGFLHAQGVPDATTLAAAYADPRGRAELAARVTILHCVTEYPAPPQSVNLRAMDVIADTFGLPVGYSDHTMGYAVALAATARGARVIEKHFTLDRALPGPDHRASLEPDELAAMVAGVREIEAALGQRLKMPSEAELANRAAARKSLIALAPIARGEVFTAANLGVKRPGTGVSPHLYWQTLGSAATRDYAADELIRI
jgi:N-acetylneuraminate synthase